jgi:hypothetical protein
MSEPKAHQLYKQVSGCNAQIAIASGTLVAQIQEGSSDWTYHEQIAGGQTYQAFVNQQSIDLSGWEAQDLTTFTTGVDIQKDKMPLVVLGGAALSCGLIWSYDFITTRALSQDELNVISGTTPGFLPSTLDLMELIYGESQILTINSNIPGSYITVGADTFGSGNPTASSKLHWTRVFITTFATSGADVAGSFVAYPANLIIQAATIEEKDLVYMERLRRSYVLQGEL